MEAEQRLRELVRRRARAGIFLDFDGTLSEIVALPSDARPLEGATDLLSQLGSTFRLVAIVSGRNARQLLAWLGGDVEIWGLHGAQRAVGGQLSFSDAARPYVELVRAARKRAEARAAALGMPGVIVEDKEVMLTLHYRAAEDPDAARTVLDDLSRELAHEFGLQRHTARSSFELRPPHDFSKADVVLKRARDLDLEAVAFIGDDLVDVPAFRALDELESHGAVALRVAVASPEAPEELLSAADVTVADPSRVLELLRGLVDQAKAL